MHCGKNNIILSHPIARPTLILLALIYLASVFTCTKDEPRLMKVLNDSITKVSVTTATIYSKVVDVGEGIDQHGYCWSKATKDFTLENCDDSISLGPKIDTGLFVQKIADLSPGSLYHIKAYLKKGNQVVLSNTLDFNTLTPSSPVVSTGDPGKVTINSIEINGTIESIGLTATESITDYGHCWSSIIYAPTTYNSLTKNGSRSDTVTYTSTLTNLIPNTTYYIRAYAINEADTGYGSTKMVTTLNDKPPTKPFLTTTPPTDITKNSAKSGGYNINNGGDEVMHKGICWNTSHNPDTSDDYFDKGHGDDDFVSILVGLKGGTQYYVRAYAENSIGISYGQEESFKTDTTPTLGITSVPSLTAISATIEGIVIDDGGEQVTSRGIFWDTTANPTKDDHITPALEGGSGTFVCNLTNLDPQTTYFVKAYAENIYGISYGSEINFETDYWICGIPFLDPRAGGRSYSTVQIGTQCWMAENLNIGTRINVSDDQLDDGAIQKYCYENRESSCDTFGGIYQWNEMMQYSTTESVKGICPDGWHLPSDNEWQVLEMALGMTSAAAGSTGYRGIDEGGKLKDEGYVYWKSPNTGATNASGFTALAAGWVSSKTFVDKGYAAVLWTSSSYDVYSWYRDLLNTSSKIYRNYGSRPNGTPVRCIKD
jgi:uncharacterized protein (TIGR02145 family)